MCDLKAEYLENNVENMNGHNYNQLFTDESEFGIK